MLRLQYAMINNIMYAEKTLLSHANTAFPAVVITGRRISLSSEIGKLYQVHESKENFSTTVFGSPGRIMIEHIHAFSNDIIGSSLKNVAETLLDDIQ